MWKLIADFFSDLEAQKSYHRELKSHAQTIQNFDKFREKTENELKEHCENEKKYDITITELTKAKEEAESSLQDTLNDLEATKSSLGSQYDSLKEQFEPLKKDSQMLKKFKNVLSELQNPESGAGKSSLNLSQSFSKDLMDQIMEEKSVLTEKFESVQNQLLETQNALTIALEKEKNLKRKKMLKIQAKNEKKLKLNSESSTSEMPELSDESDEDENDDKIEKSEVIEQK